MKYNHTASFLERLNGVTASSNGWEARCPCRNDDNNPSLSIHEKDDGQILVIAIDLQGHVGQQR